MYGYFNLQEHERVVFQSARFQYQRVCMCLSFSSDVWLSDELFQAHSSDQSFHLIPPKCSWLIFGSLLFVVMSCNGPSCMISAPAAQFCDHVAFAGSTEPELNSRVGRKWCSLGWWYEAIPQNGWSVVVGFTSRARLFCASFLVICGTLHIVFDLRWPSTNWAAAKKTGIAVGLCGEHKKLSGTAGLRSAKQAL